MGDEEHTEGQGRGTSAAPSPERTPPETAAPACPATEAAGQADATEESGPDSAAALARAALRQAPRPVPLGPASRARARRAASAAAARRREEAERSDSPAARVRAGLRRAGEAERGGGTGARDGTRPDTVDGTARATDDVPVRADRPRPADADRPRPADAARAALRSARARAPQAAAKSPGAAPAPGTRLPPAPAQAASPAPRPAPAPAPAQRVPAPASAPVLARRTYRPDTATGAGAPATAWSQGWERAVAALATEPGRFARAREYLRAGRVGTVTLTAGTALAYVQGGRARPYRVSLRTRHLPEPAWERLTEACAARADRVAALLDGGLPGALADAEGAALLPGPGEPAAECACPDPVRPCKHGLALALRLAGLLAAEPHALLLLRGRDPEAFTEDVSRRHARIAARGDAEATALPGVRAGELYGRAPGPLPPPLPVPVTTEPPPAYPAGANAPDPLVLDRLASDAGTRALALLRTGSDPLADCEVWEDAVRIAAAHPGTGLTGAGRALYARLARATDTGPGTLHRAVAAWRGAGAAGLRALEDPPWNPPAGPFDRARSLLLAAGHPPYRPHGNRLTSPDGTRQLRMDREGWWYAYESEAGADDWWPRGTAAKDPVVALESAAPEGDEAPEDEGAEPYIR